MEFIRGLHNVRDRHRGCVASIGNFDGVHLGHRAVVNQLALRARSLRLPSTLVIFEPQPREFFLGSTPIPPRLTRLTEKIVALRQLAVDRVVCLQFNNKLASLSPQEFVQRILVDGLGARFVVVGDDFRFGARRAGDFAMLQGLGHHHGFDVAATETLIVEGERVSSTRIRELLSAGDLPAAARLLGRPYRICGRVAHGDKIGRTLEVPTANIPLRRQATALHGIFVVNVHGLADGVVAGVASVGNRPVLGGRQTLLEVHLFDFSRDIYHRRVEVEFLSRLRDERHFDSLEELKQAMEQDIRAARHWLAERYGAARHVGRS